MQVEKVRQAQANEVKKISNNFFKIWHKRRDDQYITEVAT